jgi:hypothetical protein
MPVRIADAFLSIALNSLTFLLGVYYLCKFFPHLELIGRSMNVAAISNSFLKLTESVFFV